VLQGWFASGEKNVFCCAVVACVVRNHGNIKPQILKKGKKKPG
jgi:hypothetical protein